MNIRVNYLVPIFMNSLYKDFKKLKLIKFREKWRQNP